MIGESLLNLDKFDTFNDWTKRGDNTWEQADPYYNTWEQANPYYNT